HRAAAFAAEKSRIKGLSKKELEMLDPKLLENEDFIEQLSNDQVKAIQENDRFTRTQKDAVKIARTAPLFKVLKWLPGTTDATDPSEVKRLIGKMSPSELSKLPPSPNGGSILVDKVIFPSLSITKLKGLATAIDDSALIADIRTKITAASTPGTYANTAEQLKVDALATWINDPAKGALDFS
ncbi:hypothetical protein K2X05_02930, partial [bacterium]|nr:hypothetical protein [bacterium]